MAFHSAPVKIYDRSNGDHIYQSEISVQTLAQAEHLVNGLKALGLCWLIALVCVLIPVMHFFLVPGMFVVGIVMFFVRSRLKYFRAALEIACPNCKAPVAIKAAPFNWPIREMCTNCRADAVIDLR